MPSHDRGSLGMGRHQTVIVITFLDAILHLCTITQYYCKGYVNENMEAGFEHFLLRNFKAIQ